MQLQPSRTFTQELQYRISAKNISVSRLAWIMDVSPSTVYRNLLSLPPDTLPLWIYAFVALTLCDCPPPEILRMREWYDQVAPYSSRRGRTEQHPVVRLSPTTDPVAEEDSRHITQMIQNGSLAHSSRRS